MTDFLNIEYHKVLLDSIKNKKKIYNSNRDNSNMID